MCASCPAHASQTQNIKPSSSRGILRDGNAESVRRRFSEPLSVICLYPALKLFFVKILGGYVFVTTFEDISFSKSMQNPLQAFAFSASVQAS
jgi:hypothetical protein